MNMNNCGRQHFRKHREIKYSENYITLDILLIFGSLEKMIITSSEPKQFGKISKWVDCLSVSQYQCKFKEKSQGLLLPMSV